ncbi:sigma-54 interaction domain-containing protein [Silvibacterium acidisoli]|uniref:sigma-54 interaction domain-containing protein n=1 Tax=Acidobacteriaceae bacterium ZG23-2 TaxID=2883246 RepID=UPI00406CC17F
MLPALIAAVGCERVAVLSELGDTWWRTHAHTWKIRAFTKPLMRQDLEQLMAQPETTMPLPAGATADKGANAERLHVEEMGNNRFFLAASPKMLQIYKDIRVLAPIDVPVLILGESGVGKEVVAMLLHKYHARAEKKFLNVNCAALPSELLESELFGYEVGAFTGAVKAKPGKFELAHKGTLLLDEIGEMSPQMQAKLLHVLQDGTFSRLGAQTTTQVDVRIVAATNIDMLEAIAERRFREDLYYRLNAFTIVVPPLRERREEIPLLIEQLIQRGAAELGQKPLVFSSRLMEAARQYHWPGNLRELRNFVTRVLILQDQEAAYHDLMARPQQGGGGSGVASNAFSGVRDGFKAGMKGAVADVKNRTEVRMIQDALNASGWNRKRAATDLNISYRALLYKIQQHGLTSHPIYKEPLVNSQS